MDLVSEACKGCPLTLRLVAAALCEGITSEDEVLTQLGMLEAGPTDSALSKWAYLPVPTLEGFCPHSLFLTVKRSVRELYDAVGEQAGFASSQQHPTTESE